MAKGKGEKVAELCREFDISRKTGYKTFQRHRDLGLERTPAKPRGPDAVRPRDPKMRGSNRPKTPPR